MGKIVKRLLFIFLLIILVFLLNYVKILILYKLNKNITSTYIINGIDDKYVPQGLAIYEDSKMILQTSYNAKGKVSKLYLTDMNTNSLVKELDLFLPTNEPNTGHVSGLALSQSKVWISNNYFLEEYDLDEILTTNDSKIIAKKEYKLKNRGDFCFYKNGILWIGDFYLYPIYKAPNNKPLLLGYEVSQDIDFDSPTYKIEIPALVQGMTMDDNNNFIFSKSYSNFLNSRIVVYENHTNSSKEYKLSKDSLIKKFTVPPMSEGLIFNNNKLYILFESGSSKYVHAFPKVKNLLSIDL
ncbi:MAG: hypothetical protein IKN74_06155 [Clostridia bacterium]|nr:hypothetical protein [Clostridia bacterium]